MYILELYARGLSRKHRGGTLLAYATNISHLIRFCHQNHTDLIDLTDNQFTLFIVTLIGERRKRNREVLMRDANSVIAIGRNCLDFLASVGRLYDDEDFVGPRGRILAQQRVAEIRRDRNVGGGRALLRKYWHHRAFPTPDPKKRRMPISSKNIEQLRAAVGPASKTIFQRKRRYVMLKLLEITGGRRSEVAALTIASVREAAAMSEPKLTLMTAKQRGGREEFRRVPIARHDIVFFLEFIEKNRRRVVRNTCGTANDDGYVFISETTGRKLQPNTITQEIATLATAAGINEKVSPHMFRHSFITKLFVVLIEQHRFENVDDFRRALLDTEWMKAEIQQWTGHRSVSSLDVYIHMAFGEIAGFKGTKSAVSATRILESLKVNVTHIRDELGGNLSAAEAIHLLDKLTDAAIHDLETLSNLPARESKADLARELP
jgi:integrase